MAAELSSVRKTKTSGFMTLLSYAVCEWLLIFLLFVDALFSYLLGRFAHYCELQAPCPLCSRLDHVFGKQKLGCYWSLVCSSHKEEISSLVSCSTHGELADANEMCEECLMPIAMHKNSESHKLLIGKLRVDSEGSVSQTLMLNKHIKPGSSCGGTCSCCNKTWIPKAERLLELNLGLGASKANVKPPLPRVSGHSRFRRRDSFKRVRGKIAAPTRLQPTGCSSVDAMSYVGYTKLRFSSDSESEFPPSEDDDCENTGSSGNNIMNPEYDVGFGKRDLPGSPVDNVVSETQTNLGSEMKDQAGLKTHQGPSLTDEHCLRELSSPESSREPSGCLTTEPISSNDVSQPPDIGSLGASADTPIFSLPHSSAVSAVPELLFHNLTITEKPINIGETCQKVNTSATIHVEAAARTSSDDTCSSNSNCKNRTHSLSQSTENMELSCEHEVEPINASDSARTEEYMKSISQVSTSEVGLLLKDSSPRPDAQRNESTKEEDSSSQALPLPAPSLIRNDSSYESLDGLSVSDIEGESIVDRLRRQVEYDRSCMRSLYEELDQERNAAAVAANEAMAMITRLQEEKAGLQMEAWQYLRMMEEQSEYDRKALERANDLLSEREKELQDFEYELEFYRNNLPDESGLEDLQNDTSVLENHAAARAENTPGTSSDSASAKISKANGEGKPMICSVSDFEDEKLYISQCLKKLEDKFYKGYYIGNVDGMPNGQHSCKYFPPNMDALSNENPAQYYASIDTFADGKENDFHYEKSDYLPNSAAFKKEIAAVHDRLEALETDRDLLKYASNLLCNGKDELQLIQDLAHQLQELRKIEFRWR